MLGISTTMMTAMLMMMLLALIRMLGWRIWPYDGGNGADAEGDDATVMILMRSMASVLKWWFVMLRW